jgi:hypothetical protein
VGPEAVQAQGDKVMNSTQAAFGRGSPAETNGRAQQIDSIAWAVFFIWVGVAMLAQVPWGWFLLGVGILVLIAQLARWQMDMKIEVFWVACGTVFLAGGLWNLLNLPWPLAPILLILLGVALLGKTVAGVGR